MFVYNLNQFFGCNTDAVEILSFEDIYTVLPFVLSGFLAFHLLTFIPSTYCYG